MTPDRVTLDRAVVERAMDLLDTCEDYEAVVPIRAALRDALRGAEPETPRLGSYIEHDGGPFCRCAGCMHMAHSGDFNGPHPSRHPDPMPEPPSGSVTVTIDGLKQPFLWDGAYWRDVDGQGFSWQQVLDARDPGTEVRRG